MEIKHSAKFRRQRKLMVMLPLLVLPFITMAFWALGGGKPQQQGMQPDAAGLNLELPSANFPADKNEDKLSFYMEADADSLKRAELMRNDPFYRDSIIRSMSMTFPQQSGNSSMAAASTGRSYYSPATSVDEQKIYQQIDAIEKQVNQPAAAKSQQHFVTATQHDEQFSSDVTRMEDMMQLLGDKGGADPEMQQLDGTLDKILDIQHPSRVLDRLKEKSASQREVVFPVTRLPQVSNISLLDTGSNNQGSAEKFYSLDNDDSEAKDDNAVEAVVHDNQILVNGAIIRMRLTTDVYVSGSLVPKGSFINGIVSLNGERLEVTVNSMRNGSSIYGVKLQVYDLDGLPGIYVPGAITRDVAKQSADNATQSLALNSLNPSIGAQAAGAGIEAAKNLLSRKVKLVKVAVKAGYRVLLKDNNQQ